MKKVLILGSSGWVAHYLIQELLNLGVEVLGVSNTKKPLYEIENITLSMDDPDYIEKISAFKCDCILNMLHSKDFDLSYKINVEVSEYCKRNDIHHVFMSSSNALDGDASRAHKEDELAFGSSEYGVYKAKTEKYLYENSPDSCIIRFAATHGYAPNRIARTEDFLKRLKEDGEVIVGREIYQNRLYVGHLAQMMARITVDKHFGIFHLGTTDQSEEFEFLAHIAEGFGYSREQMRDGDVYNMYMTVYPKRILDLYGEEFRFSEKDTLDVIIRSSELKKYVNTAK